MTALSCRHASALVLLAAAMSRGPWNAQPRSGLWSACSHPTFPVMTTLARRIADSDWSGIETSLDRLGYATLPGLLTRRECEAVANLYTDDQRFRSRVVMERHAFGLGEYKYLRYPLPPLVETLRQACYPRLVPVANRWRELLREKGRFPVELDAYLRECHAAGQTKPTPDRKSVV